MPATEAWNRKDAADRVDALREIAEGTFETIVIHGDKLDALLEGQDRIEHELGEIRRHFTGVDTRLDGIDTRLDGHDRQFDGLNTRLDDHDRQFDGLNTRLDGIDTRLDDHGRQLDQHGRQL